MKGVIITIGMLFMLISVQAQNAHSEQLEVHQYLYSFTGAIEQTQLDKLEKSVYQIHGITEAKITYKWDSGAGMLFFTHTSYPKKGELATSFNPADIKRIISDTGLVPFEFREL